MRSSKFLGLVLVFSVLLAGVAFADNLVSDTDGLLPINANNNNVDFNADGVTICENDTSPARTVLFALRRQGVASWADGTVVTLTVDNQGGSTVAVPSITANNQITVPAAASGATANWSASSNNTLSTTLWTGGDAEKGYAAATLTLPTTLAGTFNGNVRFKAADEAETNDETEQITWSGTVLPSTHASCASNSAPVITGAAFANATVNCGPNNATLHVNFTDLDPVDTHTATVNWGDGSAVQNLGTVTSPFSAPHTYANAGTYIATVTVTDQGGLSDSETATVTVLYNSSGILQPINADGTSTFKTGSTIPVQAAFTDCDGSLPVSNPRISLEKTSNGSGSVNEVVSSSAADTGDWMRYTDDKYKFNLSTKRSQFNAGNDLTAGVYELTIKIDGVPQLSVDFGLRK